MKNQIILSAIALASMGFAATEADAQFYAVKNGAIVYSLEEGEIDYITFTKPEKIYKTNIFYLNFVDNAGQIVRSEELRERRDGSYVYQADVNNVEQTAYFYAYDDGTKVIYLGKGEGDKFVRTTNRDEVKYFEVEAYANNTTFLLDLNEKYEDSQTFHIISLNGGVPKMVGWGAGVPWEMDKAVPFVSEDREPGKYSYTGDFRFGNDGGSEAETFKIALGNTWNDPFFFAPSEDAEIEPEGELSSPRLTEGKDFKWKPTVEQDGVYTFTIYLSEPVHYTFVKSEE